MPTEVIMPKVDMVMETGTLTQWLKNEGDTVHRGDPIFVIETDKAAIEAEAPGDGVLAGIQAKPGDVVPVSQVIAYILGPGEALPNKHVPEPVLTVVPAAQAAEAPAAAEVVICGKVRATPVARRIAREMQVDLSQITGRGPRGRIQSADVLAFQKVLPERIAPAAAPVMTAPTAISAPAMAIPLPDARRKQVVPMTGARKIIAERMAYSAATAPHINLTISVDMTEAIRLRERLLEPIQAQTGQRLSYTAILARAVATALPRHPYLNASVSDGNIILWEDVHLGIATSVEDNLIVPVIRAAQQRGLGQIVAALADLTERGRTRKLLPSEMTGSTFTISNLGMFGIEAFTAIINPPESAILAVGKMTDAPVRTDAGIEFHPMIQMTLAADHRVIDGACAARFLADLKACLENPYLLI